MGKKTHTWKQRAINAKTGTPPIMKLPEKPKRDKHPEPAWILPVQIRKLSQSESEKEPAA